MDPYIRNLILIAGVLLVAVVAFPLWRLDSAITTLQANLDAVQQEASSLSDKNAMLLARQDAQIHLLNRRLEVPSKIQVIQELTKVIPDHTWVSRLGIAGRQVSLAGESDKATDLIETLEYSKLFQDVSFGSPVSRNPKSNRDRYEIRMTLVAKE